MSRRSLHLIAVSSLLTISSLSFAGGPDANVATTSQSAARLGAYVDAYFGYGFSNWSKFTDGGNGAWALIGGIRPNSDNEGGFNFGGDLGYQIIPYFGLEFGYYHFKKVRGDSLSIKTPYFYAMAKVSYPFLDNDALSVFGKFGAAIRMIEYGGAARQGPYNNKRYSFRPVYGLGAKYYLSQRWNVSAQWLEIPKQSSGKVNSKKSSGQVPRTDQILLGIGYLFSV